ncbi:MAG: UDP-N-acetylmuramoyl-L-alanine--D-glutamate ligase [Alphaproteobacteria bacterium]|nr:UDP-N-acetylmuramoyl-L-alanine--D-glutamate ligase [Alphaproteobacteria bacterium]
MMNLKPFVEKLAGRPVAVFGLGLSGLAAVKALCGAGAEVLAWDDKAQSHAAAQKAGAEIVPLSDKNLKKCAFLVLAPGVPLHYPAPHAVVLAARAAGIEIIGDLELLHRMGHGRKTIGITGTNGKSTTTALLFHILNAAGSSVAMGGNIGKAVFDLKTPAKDGAFILEMSSYQIDLCAAYRPDIAVLLNITSDHIDRHGSFEKYVEAKERLFEGDGLAVIAVDDEPSQKIYDRLIAAGRRKTIPVSCRRTLAGGVYVEDGNLFDATGEGAVEAGSLRGLTALKGAHNHQNAAVAYAVCRLMGMGAEEIMTHMQSYPGLKHRQFPVRDINGVVYIDDSKATNAEATAKALAAYQNIYWIAGGRAKEGGLTGLEHLLEQVRHVFLIGEAMEDFSKWLNIYDIPHNRSATLDVAVKDAHSMAQGARGQPGGAGVVLLSPACASFDQFKSFEDRGETFTRLVMNLDEAGENHEGGA